jgi:trigger factor
VGPSDLTVKSEPSGTRQLRLTVDVPEERVQQAMREVARRLARERHIAGFRKGKAPYAVIVQRYGEEAIREMAAEALVDPVYREVIESEGLGPYGATSLEDMELNPLRFVYEVPLMPSVELGDYRALRIKPPKVRVTKKEVREVLEELREEHAILEPAGDRPAKKGDKVYFSVVGSREDGGVFLDDDEAELLLDPDEAFPYPGFQRELVGMREGEERTFQLDAPSGKVKFTVRLLELRDRFVPNIDDDLARTVGHFNSLEELEEDIRAYLRKQNEEEAQREYVDKIIDALLKGARIEYPQAALDDEIDDLMEDLEERVQKELRISLEDYIKLTKKSEEELRAELRPRAEENLRRALVLAEVAVAEGIQVTDEEVESYLQSIDLGEGEEGEKRRRQIKDNEAVMTAIRNKLFGDKVIRRLVAIARGEAMQEKEEELDDEAEQDGV